MVDEPRTVGDLEDPNRDQRIGTGTEKLICDLDDVQLLPKERWDCVCVGMGLG